MINRFKQVDIDDALPGMVLSDAILDGHGGVLLPAGASLTESSLQSLRRRGIDELVVLNDDLSEAELEAERAHMQLRLDRLFRKYADNKTNGLLLQYLTQYRFGGPA